MPPIIVSAQGPPASSAYRFLSEHSEASNALPDDTPLLRAIKIALRGPGAENDDSIHTGTHFTGNREKEPELTWDKHTVVLSYGAVLAKRWSFKQEGELVQWACIGELEQVIQHNPASAATAANLANVESLPPNADGRDTFGPFARAKRTRKFNFGHPETVPAVFIFLRSIGKIYLLNGMDYTFSVPFVVRKAWAISPHGVMIQRVLEPSELIEAEATGDDVLPTIFTVTSALSEAAAVGLTSGILGPTPTTLPTLKDEDEHSSKPLKSIPPTEMAVWVSHCSIVADVRVVVTVNVEKRLLSVWQYVYIKPKDTPQPLTRQKNRVPPPTSAAPSGGAGIGMGPPPSKRQSTSGTASRRTSAMFDGVSDRRERIQPMSPSMRSHEPVIGGDIFEFPEMPALSSLPGMAPSLSTTTTMASLVSGSQASQRVSLPKRRNSLSRNDLSTTMDRMVLGGRMDDNMIAPIEYGRMKAAFWMQSMYTQAIPVEDAEAWRDITVSLFDDRFDGTKSRCLISICLPISQKLFIYTISQLPDRTMEVTPTMEMPAMSATSLRATRGNVWDLLVVKPFGQLSLFTHGLNEIPVQVQDNDKATGEGVELDMYMDVSVDYLGQHGQIVSVSESQWGTTTLAYEDGYKTSVTFDIFPEDKLVIECFQLLALILPTEITFEIHRLFLEKWSARSWSTAENVEFECFSTSLYSVFHLDFVERPVLFDPWLRLAETKSHEHFAEDPALRLLRKPPNIPPALPQHRPDPPHKLLAPLLYGLHTLAEHMRLLIPRQHDLLRFAPVVCRIAIIVRPEWADYWKRLIPDVMNGWPLPLKTSLSYLDDRIPVWPPDLSAILYGRVSTPDWKVPWHDVQHIVTRFSITPSLEYGVCDPLHELHELSLLYNTLSDGKVTDTQQRAENVVYQMVAQNGGQDVSVALPLGIAAPLREAARTCQLAPPSNWPLEAYRAIGRNDLAASAYQNPEVFITDGYKPRKEFVNPSTPRQTIGEIAADVRTLAAELDGSTGVELNLKEFTDIRFGLDRRLDEVARMLCSSVVASVKIADRPELSEHDQTKEHQNQVVRIAERTLALPYGRAMFTFGSIPVVKREAYAIPKIEYNVRFQPSNILVTPEPGKIAVDSISWGEFHNGVAAGLRISPSALGVDSSWIAFNKPIDLTPEHAGFLLALGLTGHLKEMMTWSTFGYLTPKHDLTSIGVLLGMAAANVGTANQHVTKLLAVHTPAMLPGPNVELNVPLITQTAGLFGTGLIYLGTRNRRMAEVCLGQVSRRDLVQPDLNNEHREAYTYASAFAFGMIMLGKGSSIPADLMLLKRLGTLIHGDADVLMGKHTKTPFDINLTSPAATISLGLMYLKTNRKDVAEMLTIPDTVVSLNAIQPNFLLIRTIARSLIMWDDVVPSNDWLIRQIPRTIINSIESRSKEGFHIDDSMELAYYNIIAGGCFVVGLKYAGTARQEAYQMIVKHFDHFSRMAYANGPAFDHKIKRSAIRDGLNLISIALSMVMAGTGEITCLRRLRYAYGMSQQMLYHHGFKYGVHVATHMSLGLLFLGGGRYTLGTSDAAIACMVVAFFPRFNHISSDNRSFLQALRHMWVLAVEPRCLIARDVDTNEVVYLPVKIKMQEGDSAEHTQLISPTLIPDMDKLMSVRVDTPRYWPFYLDTSTHPRHKEALLQSQTLYVKRRTAFLSYTEDPRGSRSLFVRSGSSSGDAATLDFPQLTDTKTHPAGDLSEFISSFSNNVLFLAFADHFSRAEDTAGGTHDERLFHTYCHAALLDSILQDKPQTLQAHLTLYFYRNMTPKSRYFHLRLQDLRFAADFYTKVYERRFSGRAENNARPGLVRDTTVQGVLYALDRRLDSVRTLPGFARYMGHYARGEHLPADPRADYRLRPQMHDEPGGDMAWLSEMRVDREEELDGAAMERYLAWYLLRNGVPVSTLLAVLRQLAQDAHKQCLGVPPPEGTSDADGLDRGIKEVLHATGTKMTTALGSGWSVRSLNEIIDAWKIT